MGSWRVLADIESGTRENEVITPWSQMPYLIQLVQGTEQAIPLYDPVHGSGPGEIVFRHMSVVQPWRPIPVSPQLKLCSLASLGRLVRPRSGRKTRRLWPQTADFISEDVPSPDSLRVDADRRLGHVRSRELRADGPPCDAPQVSFGLNRLTS